MATLTTSPDTVTLQHGTTVRRARLIAAHGPDPNYREPGGAPLPPAEGFSTCLAGEQKCQTGLPRDYAFKKHKLFPNEGGPAIIEIQVPSWIVDLLLADSLSADSARGGEYRFEPESGLNELLAEWPSLTKRVILL